MTYLRRLVPPGWRPLKYLENKTRRVTGCAVVGGPFRGMRYVERCAGTYIPKLLGIFERELASRVEKAISLAAERIVVVGAAEGYYAVGMACRCPEASVIAYEKDPSARAALERLAELNGVGGRLKILGFCDRQRLAETIGKPGKTLLIFDCEGCELILLDPLRLPALRHHWILVEVHDFCVPGTGDELRQRFEASHQVEQIWQEEAKRGKEFPYSDIYTRRLPSSYLDWAMSEWRPERMYWFWMEPRHS